jgi:hypothetical protein
MNKVMIGRMVRGAQLILADEVRPRDDFENAVVCALGEISWDEAVAAIEKYRAGPPQPAPTEAT